MASLTEIVERDGHACVWCGREPWLRDLTLEHLLPRSRGGRATFARRQLALLDRLEDSATRPRVLFAHPAGIQPINRT